MKIILFIATLLVTLPAFSATGYRCRSVDAAQFPCWDFSVEAAPSFSSNKVLLVGKRITFIRPNVLREHIFGRIATVTNAEGISTLAWDYANEEMGAGRLLINMNASVANGRISVPGEDASRLTCASD
jgi:hypothetical protein